MRPRDTIQPCWTTDYQTRNAVCTVEVIRAHKRPTLQHHSRKNSTTSIPTLTRAPTYTPLNGTDPPLSPSIRTRDFVFGPPNPTTNVAGIGSRKSPHRNPLDCLNFTNRSKSTKRFPRSTSSHPLTLPEDAGNAGGARSHGT
jgi:hypothetical protein